MLMRTELPQQAKKWQWLPLHCPALLLTPYFPFHPCCVRLWTALQWKEASKDTGNTNKHKAIKRTMGDVVWCTFANKQNILIALFKNTLHCVFFNLWNGRRAPCTHPAAHKCIRTHSYRIYFETSFLCILTIRDKLFARRQSSCMALTAPLSHKWYLKSRKQMRAKAPFKVHLRCLKSIHTHILLRSLLYELLMKSTFCYPTLLMHRGKKKQTRKPTQAVGKQMHHSVPYQHGLGSFGSSREARYICRREEGN